MKQPVRNRTVECLSYGGGDGRIGLSTHQFVGKFEPTLAITQESELGELAQGGHCRAKAQVDNRVHCQVIYATSKHCGEIQCISGAWFKCSLSVVKVFCHMPP